MMDVAILGATGAVGQRFVQLLAGHPFFTVREVAASGRSAGRRYAEACHWTLPAPLPDRVGDLVVKPLDAPLDSPLVFSALPADVAGEVEERLAGAGHAVSTNARNHRMDADVPLLIPEVNPESLDLVARQRRERGWKGAVITNANCSTMFLAIALAPLERAFGVEKVFVTTLQAVSGAGCWFFPTPPRIAWTRTCRS